MQEIVYKYMPEFIFDLQDNQILLTKLLSKCMDTVYENGHIAAADVYRLNAININKYNFSHYTGLIQGLFELSQIPMNDWSTEVKSYRVKFNEPDF